MKASSIKKIINKNVTKLPSGGNLPLKNRHSPIFAISGLPGALFLIHK
jgi:hypothetical protein